VFFGDATVKWWKSNMLPGGGDEDAREAAQELAPIEWLLLRRREPTSIRSARQISSIQSLLRRRTVVFTLLVIHCSRRRSQFRRQSSGTVALWPLKPDGTECSGFDSGSLKTQLADGFVRVNNWKAAKRTGSVQYLQTGIMPKIRSGEITVTGRADDARSWAHSSRCKRGPHHRSASGT